MTKLELSIATCFLLIVCPVSGQETIASSVRKSTVANVETKIAVLLEKSKAEIDFCIKNRGRGFDEINVSKMGSMEAYEMGVNVITDGLIASKYEWYGDLSKAADYYYKDYLVQEGKRPWKSKHSWSSPGDSTPFPVFMYVLKRAQEYERMLKVYPEYFEYSFLGRIRGPKGRKLSKEEEIHKLKENMKYDTELKGNYDSFIKEWGEVKKLSQTENPKPLDPAVQHHEWFYSDKQAEVLKALEYYHTNKVKFMMEKALGHKNSGIAAKAKEYLEKFTEADKK